MSQLENPGSFTEPIRNFLRQGVWLLSQGKRLVLAANTLDIQGLPPGTCSSHLHIQGPKYSSRHSFCTSPGTLININFPQNFPLALIGCSGAPVLPQPWALQLLLGSTTVQTCYALCAKIYIFYICCILIPNKCLYVASTGISGTVIYHFFFFGFGLEEGPVAILFFMEVELHLFSCVH